MAFGRTLDIRNNTTSDILVKDLGILVPANIDDNDINVARITSSVTLDRANYSRDLKELVDAGTISVNGYDGDGDGTLSANLTAEQSASEINVSIPKLKVEYAEDETESQTTGVEYIEKLSHTFTTGAADYLVQWGAEVKTTFGQIGIETRVKIDGLSQIHEAHWTPNSTRTETITGLEGWAPASGFQKVTFTAGQHTVSLDFASSRKGRSVNMRRARLLVTRI